MPYSIIKREGPKPWKIVNTDRDETVGSSSTKGDAEASIRARSAAEHGTKFCDIPNRKKYTDSDLLSFMEQFKVSYTDAYRLFELDSVGIGPEVEESEDLKAKLITLPSGQELMLIEIDGEDEVAPIDETDTSDTNINFKSKKIYINKSK